jgi:hypothetical protein
MIETSVQSHPFSATRNLLQSSAKEPSPPPAASPHIHSRVEFEEASLTFALLDLLALLVDLLLAMSDRTDANAQRVSTLPPDGDDDSTSTVSDMVEVPFATAVLMRTRPSRRRRRKRRRRRRRRRRKRRTRPRRMRLRPRLRLRLRLRQRQLQRLRWRGLHRRIFPPPSTTRIKVAT